MAKDGGCACVGDGRAKAGSGAATWKHREARFGQLLVAADVIRVSARVEDVPDLRRGFRRPVPSSCKRSASRSIVCKHLVGHGGGARIDDDETVGSDEDADVRSGASQHVEIRRARMTSMSLGARCWAATRGIDAVMTSRRGRRPPHGPSASIPRLTCFHPEKSEPRKLLTLRYSLLKGGLPERVESFQ